jgi:hypothetical protein
LERGVVGRLSLEIQSSLNRLPNNHSPPIKVPSTLFVVTSLSTPRNSSTFTSELDKTKTHIPNKPSSLAHVLYTLHVLWKPLVRDISRILQVGCLLLHNLQLVARTRIHTVVASPYRPLNYRLYVQGLSMSHLWLILKRRMM